MYEKYLFIKQDNEIDDDNAFEDTLYIYNRLSEKEQELLRKGHTNESYTVYRKVIRTNNGTPMGYVELDDIKEVYKYYNIPMKSDVNELMIGLAVDKDFRRIGIGQKLINYAIQWFMKSDYKAIWYYIRYGNENSEKLAKKCGFTLDYDNKKSKEKEYVLYKKNII